MASVLNDQHIHLKKTDLIDSPLFSLNSHDKRYYFTARSGFYWRGRSSEEQELQPLHKTTALTYFYKGVLPHLVFDA